jgi:hypothetical protein
MPLGSGRLRLPDFHDFRHYEGGKVVTLTHRPPLPPGVSWYSFLEAESTAGHMVPSVATEKFPIGDRSRYLPTSSAVAVPSGLLLFAPCNIMNATVLELLQFCCGQGCGSVNAFTSDAVQLYASNYRKS